MTVQLKGGAQFLHIPKTGGTWVEKILEELDLVERKFGHEHADFDRVVAAERHLPTTELLYSAIRRKLLELAFRYEDKEHFKFCFVRNPLTWYESWWRYMEGLGWPNWGTVDSRIGWHPNSELNGLGSSDFNTFVMNVLKKRPGYVSALYYSYAKTGVDFIGRLESLRPDLAAVLDRLGLQYERDLLMNAKRVNVSSVPSNSLEWDPVVRDAVIRVELPALIRFGYVEHVPNDLGFLLQSRNSHIHN